MTLRLLDAAVETPLGDLDATAAAIAASTRAGVRDPATGILVARLLARASGGSTRTVAPLPAIARDVAKRAVGAGPLDRRTGVFVAVGGLRAQCEELGPAMAEQRADGRGAWARGLSRMHPLWMLRYLSNAAHAWIAADLAATGDGATFAGAASAASALVAADAALAERVIDHAVIVALDDLTGHEAVELTARRSGVVPGAGVAAMRVTAGGDGDERADGAPVRGRSSAEISAVDGVSPDVEPSAADLTAARARLAPADRDVTFSPFTGWLGAAGPLIDAILAARFQSTTWPDHFGASAARSVTISAAGSPGQLGIIRIEAAR